MPQNAELIKEKIVNFISQNGPSLPVQIAKAAQLDGIFAAAFVSELLGEKKVKMTNMRVGTSPVYFIKGQEAQLENYAQYLKSKEKEAYLHLREMRFLKDSEQEPAIRVALNAIKDFAIPFQKGSEKYWRYFIEPEKEIEEEKKVEIKEIPKEEVPIKSVVITEKVEKPKRQIKKPAKTSAKSSPANKKKEEKFLERVKEFLSKDSVEILSVEGFGKEELTLKVRVKGEEQILIAYNKKKISDKEVIKAAKKASEFKLKYSILSLGELPKKISDLIEALQNMKDIEKIY
ncbi:Uncharacterised protein [uncultured archaeon]|nr:Uncharacterised protein [uncultured archaeon]